MEYTYESGYSKSPLEYYEWDNIWWDTTSDGTSTRFLYVGDSISCEIRRRITAFSEKRIIVDGFGSSKALDNPYFLPSVDMFVKQMQKLDGVIFNNGLHGWHLSDEEYEKYYEKALEFIKGYNVPVFVLLTTDAEGSKQRKDGIIARNEIAKKLADKFGFKVIDIYTMTKDKKDMHTPDGVHFTGESYDLLAKEIIKSL